MSEGQEAVPGAVVTGNERPVAAVGRRASATPFRATGAALDIQHFLAVSRWYLACDLDVLARERPAPSPGWRARRASLPGIGRAWRPVEHAPVRLLRRR